MLRLHLSPVPYAGRSDEGCEDYDSGCAKCLFHCTDVLRCSEESETERNYSSQYIEHMPHHDLDFFFFFFFLKWHPGLEKKKSTMNARHLGLFNVCPNKV